MPIEFLYAKLDITLQQAVAKHCTVSGAEFVRRFLQHVLPKGFQRVRHDGWLGAAAQAKRERIHALLDWKAPLAVKPPVCPRCGQELGRPIPEPRGRRLFAELRIIVRSTVAISAGIGGCRTSRGIESAFPDLRRD